MVLRGLGALEYCSFECQHWLIFWRVLQFLCFVQFSNLSTPNCSLWLQHKGGLRTTTTKVPTPATRKSYWDYTQILKPLIKLAYNSNVSSQTTYLKRETQEIIKNVSLGIWRKIWAKLGRGKIRVTQNWCPCLKLKCSYFANLIVEALGLGPSVVKIRICLQLILQSTTDVQIFDSRKKITEAQKRIFASHT